MITKASYWWFLQYDSPVNRLKAGNHVDHVFDLLRARPNLSDVRSHLDAIHIMPSVRTPLRCKKPTMKSITGLLFTSNGRKADIVNVPTATYPGRDVQAYPSFPAFEAILGAGGQLHESWVTCQDGGGREYRYLIAAQYCPSCQVNRALKSVIQDVDWRGEVIVMRGGCQSFVVNINSVEAKHMARQAVSKFLVETAQLVAESIANRTPLMIPDSL
ncbi:hypothetical protein ONZ51_g10278 [Trametes cubensis]|uniref:Uncharacterized protein n=1 Tax=Trametes cubensis TaxID=1111947 RepID=A0AAD7TMD4_9APHY|nr:hypothetical protein ONZ51_g10278 [Trametes cubensis]